MRSLIRNVFRTKCLSLSACDSLYYVINFNSKLKPSIKGKQESETITD